jgi:LmbE family N-acetylglucosaminyl deacetylase
MSFTLVAFHAHPDDEALLTSGTMARASAEGHRVVLVTATGGGVGLVASDFLHSGETLESRRLAELRRSATALGCARSEVLGYADSGLNGEVGAEEAVGAGETAGAGRATPGSGGLDGAGRGAFAAADVDVAAKELAAILREERADVLTIYDPAGGYGHPDHVQVHRVGTAAAELAGTPSVLEATIDRDRLTKAIQLAGMVYRFPPEFDQAAFGRAYSPRSAITHRVDVRKYAVRKRTSMLAHASQATADGADRTLAAFLRLPLPLFRLAFGSEWYVEHGRTPGRLLDDVFASVRS